MALSYIKLRTDRKPNRKGEYALAIYAFINGVGDVKRGLKLSVEAKYWDQKKMQVKSAHPLADGFNKVISMKRSRVDNYLIECDAMGETPTAHGIDEALAGRSLGSYFTVAEKEIERIKYHCSYDHYKKVEEIINGFRGYCGGDVALGSINKEFLENYMLHLREKGNSQNTIAKKISTIRTPFLSAFNKGLVRENPFHEIKLRFKEPEKDVPTIELVRALRDVELKPDTWEWHARNAWIFAYYTHGMRFTDICLFRKKQAYEGKYVMHKNGKVVTFILVPELEKIIDQYPDGTYLFPFLSREYDTGNRDRDKALKEREALRNAIDIAGAQCNKHLKSAGLKAFQKLLTETIKGGGSAEDAGEPIMLTMHMARSAFSEHVRDTTRDVRAAQQLLKHSSLNTTQKYFDKKRVSGQLRITDELFSKLR